MATHHRPRVHRVGWRKYTTRRVVITTIIGLVAYGLNIWMHWVLANKTGEVLIGGVICHCLLEVSEG